MIYITVLKFNMYNQYGSIILCLESTTQDIVFNFTQSNIHNHG